MKKILVIAGGGKKHLAPFVKEGKRLGFEVTLASFSDLSYQAETGNSYLLVGGEPVSAFGLIYIRLVGRRFEDLALLVNEAKKLKIPVIDRVFAASGLARLPVSKLLEIKLLSKAGLPVSRTLYGKLDFLKIEAPRVFGFPFVLKSTTGKQGHEVWSPRSSKELIELIERLGEQEKKGKRFLAQEFIKAPKRIRVLVIGDRAVGAIQRPTRWRKRFSLVSVEKRALTPVPKEVADLAVRAAKTLMLDIAGVDILVEQETNKLHILEVNSAPRWESVARDCGINVEREILSYLNNLF